MKVTHLALLALLPLAACNSNPVDPFAATRPQPIPANPTASSQDQNFVALSAQSDQFEMQTSQLALQKSRRPAIRAFAQRMIDDHMQTTGQLTALAQQKGMTIPGPETLDPVLQQKLATLQAANRTFDRDYIAAQISNHQSAIQVAQTEISGGQDPDVKALAQNTLPIIQAHLRSAQQLRAR